MPIHDWSKVDAGTFHNFHQDWVTQLYRALNAGRLPPDYFALTAQRVERWEPDVVSSVPSTAPTVPPPTAVCLAVAPRPHNVHGGPPLVNGTALGL